MSKAPYDSIANKYVATNHPSRIYMAYPSWIRACGYMGGSRILDVGCGSGRSTRLLKERGALVVHGLDCSIEQIKLARAIEQESDPRKITYFHADARAIPNDIPIYNLITPTYLMQYAGTIEDLRGMARSMAEHLTQGGKVVGLTLRPDWPVQEFEPGLGHSATFVGEPFRNGSAIHFAWYDELDREICFTTCFYWSRGTYEGALEEAGFVDIEWIPLQMTDQGKTIVKEWRRLQENTIACVISARKR